MTSIIDNRQKKQHTNFTNLSFGDVFEYDNRKYIKTWSSNSDGRSNALVHQNGAWNSTHFKGQEEVLLLDAKLVIE